MPKKQKEMQKDNFRKDHKRKALMGCVGQLVFVVALKVWPPEETTAQVGLVPTVPLIVNAMSDSSAEEEKAALKEQNRIKDSTNLSLAKKVNRATGEVKAITAAKKRRSSTVPLASKEMLYFRKEGEIVYSKPITRDGEFLIIDWDSTNSEMARIEALSDTSGVDYTMPENNKIPIVQEPETKEKERTKVGRLIYKVIHPFK